MDDARLKVQKGIAIIGAGNWGSSLAAGIVAAGIPLREVVVRKATRRSVFGLAAVLFSQAKFDAEVIWICVPDGEISAAAEQIAKWRPDLRGQIVVHSSGALTTAALESARQAGALVGGIAPVYSFPTREPLSLTGVSFVVETPRGEGDALWRKLASLVRKLGGKPLRILPEKKVLYHAAATMASPLLVSALQAAVETAGLAGLDAREAEAIVRALATATLRNFFEKGAARSFSGVFARGDTGTVEVHLRALVEHPILHRVYRELSRNAVASLPVKNGVELERVLEPAAKKRRVRD